MDKITGPINIIRMEGKIFGVDKVIYLFMDEHKSIDEQTRCANKTQTIKEFLAKELSKTEKQIDFFLELTKKETVIKAKGTDKDSKYIEQLVMFFQKEFTYTNYKANSAKSNPKVRMHYLDVRDVTNDYLNSNEENMFKILDKAMCDRAISNEDLNKLISISFKMRDDLMEQYKLLFGEKFRYGQYGGYDMPENLPKDIERVKHYIKKIKNKYNHKEIAKDLIPLFNNIQYLMHDTISLIWDLGSISIDLLKKPNSAHDDRIAVVNILDKFEQASSRLLVSQSLVTDIFFLRRVLDKDYIKTILVYAGYMHILNYIHFLVKQFGFKITHASYKNKELKKINDLDKQIKKISFDDYFYRISELQYLLVPDETIQCSAMANFPPNFD